MMFRIRLVLLSLLATIATGAVASTSTFAVMPAYVDQNGALITGVLKLETKKPAGTGNSILEGTLAGIKVVDECKENNGTGTIENSATNGMGSSTASAELKKCVVVAPAGQNCLILNELITFTAHDLLLLDAGQIRDLFSPSSGSAFTTIVIDNCTTTALNGSFTVTGETVALTNNVTSSLEFERNSGGTLKFGGNPATYIDIIQALMEGGGKIGVENGT